ncbi:MAG TPA: alpha/beta fold hydrolase [Candidatus Limnocylindrales bacterium]
MGALRRTGILTAVAAAPVALAYRFAVLYRTRAGYPRQLPPLHDPSDVGLAYEPVEIPSGGLRLPGWFMPANGGALGPGVVLVHGWESARDRTLPLAAALNAAGFHVLVFDVRGNGENPPEALPVSAGEYGADSAAAARALAARSEVTTVGVVGHSMGGAGALIAAAREPRVAAAVSTSSPADPYRLTRLTFRLARLPIPGPIAAPLAWLTARVFVRPRAHRLEDVSASHAAARYRGPLLLAHGDQDEVVPVDHLGRLADGARRARASAPGPSAAVRVEVIPGGDHSYLYEREAYRRLVASFLAEALGGPTPTEAADRAAAYDARRLPEPPIPDAIEAGPAGAAALVWLVVPARLLRWARRG